MALKARFKAWILGAVALVAGGTAIATALLQSAQTEGLTCADGQKIVDYMVANNIPLVVPIVDNVISPACGITYTPECSKLPSGNLCRHGLEYGPKLGGSVWNDVTKTFDRVTCDPATGQAVPCQAMDGWFTDGEYNPATFSKKEFLHYLYNKLEREGLADAIPDD